jgi:hypothetical protein
MYGDGDDFEIKCWWDTLRFYPTTHQFWLRKITENSSQLDRCPAGSRTGDLQKESDTRFLCTEPTKTFV